MRFLVDRSRRPNSRSAWGVITTLYINLAGLPHLFDNVDQRSSRLILCFFGNSDDVHVFQQLLILVERKNDCRSLAAGIGNVLHVSRHFVGANSTTN